MNGTRAKPMPYRNGQNVIRDSATGAIVYLPPEADDVPLSMHEFVDWVRHAELEQVPGGRGPIEKRAEL